MQISFFAIYIFFVGLTGTEHLTLNEESHVAHRVTNHGTTVVSPPCLHLNFEKNFNIVITRSPRSFFLFPHLRLRLGPPFSTF